MRLASSSLRMMYMNRLRAIHGERRNHDLTAAFGHAIDHIGHRVFLRIPAGDRDRRKSIRTAERRSAPAAAGSFRIGWS